MADPTLIQVRRVLGTITQPGSDFVASFAGGGSQKCKSEADAMAAFRRLMGQGLKGNLVLERDDDKPTLVVLTMIQQASAAMFGPAFLEYDAAPVTGYVPQPSDSTLMKQWLNQAVKQSALNTLVQNDVTKAPIIDYASMTATSIKGDTGVNLLVKTPLPKNMTLFMAMGADVLAQGTLWSANLLDGLGTSTPDLSLFSSAGGLLKFYSQAIGMEQNTSFTMTALQQYVLVLERSAKGEVNIWVDNMLVHSATGAVQAGDYKAYSLLGGYNPSGSWAANIGCYTLVSRLTTQAEREAYTATIKLTYPTIT